MKLHTVILIAFIHQLNYFCCGLLLNLNCLFLVYFSTISVLIQHYTIAISIFVLKTLLKQANSTDTVVSEDTDSLDSNYQGQGFGSLYFDIGSTFNSHILRHYAGCYSTPYHHNHNHHPTLFKFKYADCCRQYIRKVLTQSIPVGKNCV